MGIRIEFNPDLALRNISEYKKGKRKKEEYIPEKIQIGKIYDFLKKGQRNYWLDDELPLLETKGNQELSRPLASIIIVEYTSFLQSGVPYTKGKYKIIDVFNIKDSKIHFESYQRIK